MSAPNYIQADRNKREAQHLSDKLVRGGMSKIEANISASRMLVELDKQTGVTR